MAQSTSNRAANIYQFKITLKGTKPKIWRRIQVPEEYSFWDLHVAIQDVMGWRGYHLHQFSIGKDIVIGKSNEQDFEDIIPEETAKIAEYFISPKNKAIYEYDFGDGWEHEVTLENILPVVTGTQYPQCTGGKLACPPEDCGGVEGYEELLEILANPQHEEYEERIEWLKRMQWLGGNFNPINFDPKLVTFENPQERWQHFH